MGKVLILQRDFLMFSFLLLLCAVVALPALAAEAGRVKVSKGEVQIERDGKRLPAPVGATIQAHDTVKTGPDGSVGITFLDNSLLSAGPNSELVIERFVFDSTTHKGEFDTALKKGTLAVVSGKIVKQSPEAMRVKTPAAIMGVRGTEFVVKVDESATK
ncbi:MAG TPA: FecR domain-containing protein [Burkholderiales bacterium]|jgi:hypothetical protein|nr:FecR domain-containing protein [Burkholderiales bacterium]